METIGFYFLIAIGIVAVLAAMGRRTPQATQVIIVPAVEEHSGSLLSLVLGAMVLFALGAYVLSYVN